MGTQNSQGLVVNSTMNVFMIIGSAVSTLILVLFVYLVYLTGGVGLDHQSLLRGVFMIRCPRYQSEGIRRSRPRGFFERGPLTLFFRERFAVNIANVASFAGPSISTITGTHPSVSKSLQLQESVKSYGSRSSSRRARR